ncbi:MAG TPA: hypothetical protein PKC25_10955, partial [Candidatus Rifleibacterium sp.]|nr:hypothetical protein [Candidatus Rifleibacterium sp.]
MKKSPTATFFRAAIGRLSGNRPLRWLLIILLTWGVPSAIFWTGLQLFVSDRLSRSSSLIAEEIERGLDNDIYDSLPARFFHPRFSDLFKQLKGLPSNNDSLGKIVAGFDRQWQTGMIDIYLFNGEGNVFPIRGARPEHELFFALANSEHEAGQISPEQLSRVGKLFPAPDLMLGRIRDQRD